MWNRYIGNWVTFFSNSDEKGSFIMRLNDVAGDWLEFLDSDGALFVTHGNNIHTLWLASEEEIANVLVSDKNRKAEKQNTCISDIS